jgi:acetyl-CoA C-acetyltransferase
MAVIVGAGQVRQRPEDLREATEVVSMMTEALREAALDAQVPKLIEELDLIAVIKGAWSYTDPARIVADRCGAHRARTVLTHDGGDTPLRLLFDLCARIDNGDIAAAAIIGGEGVWSRRRMRAADISRNVTRQEAIVPDQTWGAELMMSDAVELEIGLRAPIQAYPLLESAARARRGETIDSNRDLIAELWSRFSQISESNPYAWMPHPVEPQAIRDPRPENRMVAFPYTKLLMSNWDVDLAAAAIICSPETARAAGVPETQWVHLHAGAYGKDVDELSHRGDLADDTVVRVVGERALETAGVTVDDLQHVDLYSCYPVAVRRAAHALGLEDGRDLTLTGGMTFAGGPLNSYALHALATLVARLRETPGSLGLVTANGGYITKYAAAIFSTTPCDRLVQVHDVQDELGALPWRERAITARGAASIEAYTVLHERGDAPAAGRALLSCLLPDTRRTWVTTYNPDVIQRLVAEEHVGVAVELHSDGLLRFL